MFEAPFDLIIIFRNKRPTLNDVFTFTPEWQNPEDLVYQLYQNYPNPFNNITTIQYKIISPQRVKLEIFNILGQRMTTLVDRFTQPGIYQIQWKTQGYASGLYFYRLKAGDFIQTKKMLLIK